MLDCTTQARTRLHIFIKLGGLNAAFIHYNLFTLNTFGGYRVHERFNVSDLKNNVESPQNAN